MRDVFWLVMSSIISLTCVIFAGLLALNDANGWAIFGFLLFAALVFPTITGIGKNE